MMKVIEYIKVNGLQSLNTDFGIDIKEYDDLIVLNYNQINSPKSHPVVMECRALILDKEYNVVSRSFDRFFNLGECDTELDLNNSVVFEKADGSLINIYYNPIGKRWEISTRKSAYAEVPHVTGGTFREKVLETLGLTEKEFQAACENVMATDVTYIFEFIGYVNRHVTQYTKNELVFLAARCNSGVYLETYTEFSIINCWFTNTRLPKTFSFSNEDDLKNSIKQLPVLEEGYVVLNNVTGERIKVKNPSFLAVFNLRMNGVPSVSRMIKLVTENDYEEYLVYFPEDFNLFKPFIDTYEAMIQEMNHVWENVKDIENQKEFALSVKDRCYNGVLFSCRKYNMLPEEAFAACTDNYKESVIINYKNNIDKDC